MSDLDQIHRDYRRSLPHKRDALRRAWEALCAEDVSLEQVGQVQLLLHRLTGSAGTYGHERIAALARSLEQDWVAWKAVAEGARPPPYQVCARQAGTMAELLAALLESSDTSA